MTACTRKTPKPKYDDLAAQMLRCYMADDPLTDALDDIIERQHANWTRLRGLLGGPSNADIVRAEERVRAALRREADAARLVELSDLYSADANARQEAGFYLGVASARQMGGAR